MKKKTKSETEGKKFLINTNPKKDIYKIQKKTKEEEDEKNEDIDTKYEKYRIEDLDFISQSSNEDIESKMNKMIQIKKKGGSLLDYIQKKEMNRLQQMKITANKFQQQKELKQQQKKEEKLMKMKKGLESLNKIIPTILRNIAFRKLTKKIKIISDIKYGVDLFKKFYNRRVKYIKKKHYNNFVKYSKENKIKRNKEKEEKEKKEKEEKEMREKISKMKKEKEMKGKGKKQIKNKKQEKEKQEEIEKGKEESKDDNPNINNKKPEEKDNKKEKILSPSKKSIIKDNKDNKKAKVLSPSKKSITEDNIEKDKEKASSPSKKNKLEDNKDKEINLSPSKKSILKDKNKDKENNLSPSKKSILKDKNKDKEKNLSPSKKNIKEDNKINELIDKKDNKNKMPVLTEKGKRITSKKEKLEIMKKREENYLYQVNLQTKKQFEEMKIIDEQINKQKNKFKKLQDGLNVSMTDSNISFSIDKLEFIEKGLEIVNGYFLNFINLMKKKFLRYLIRNAKKRKRKKFESFVDSKKALGSSTLSRNNMEKVKQKYKSEKGVDKFIHKSRRSFHQRQQPSKNKNENEKEVKEVKEIEEESSFIEDDESEKSEKSDSFIHIERLGDIKKPVDKSQLVEYDLFYKEQFFKNDVFKYDVNNIQDKEVEEINHEMNKLAAKRKLIAKKKEKDVQASKGLDTEEIDAELEILEKDYIKAKTIEKPKLDMVMNNTEGLLYKGRLLGVYFNGAKEADFPRFALESEKEIGAKEVIDFKILRKEEVARRFFDYCCCLEQRKKINKYMVYARYYCRFFVDNWIFDNLSLLVIILNTILILISDPTDTNNYGNITDQYFLYFYTFEAILKIISFTFFSAEDAYIKDYWNILDFFVVLVGWISFVIEKVMNGTKISGLAGLRAFRILRPLKTVKRFKGLKKLVTALLASIAHLGETTIVLIFFFLIFAIAGRQMWSGLFYRRCMNVNFGYLYSNYKSTQMCSFDTDCEELNSYGMRFVCAKGYLNPDSGAITFDNTLTGFVTIFVMVTLEGWTTVFTYVSKTFKDKIYINPIIIFLYFHVFVFLGAFYLINLFLAVTNSEFEHIETERKLLAEKKSFFKLIMSKFNLKKKEKLDKKEKNKKKKENNNSKSDQALVDLYYKIKDDAFSINKNKRNIPVLYSTVKDMYIMSNNNPEEIYLQDLRIENEETFLGKDIKRQQREIDALIDEKRKEMKVSLKDKKKEEQKDKDNENIDKTFTQQSKLKTIRTIKSYKSQNSEIKKNNTGGYTPLKNNTKNSESVSENIIKLMNRMNKEILKDSINNAQKKLIEKIEIIKKGKKKEEEETQEDLERNALRRKIEKKEKKKMLVNQIVMEEDLPFEKEIRLANEKKKKQMEEIAKKEDAKLKMNKFKSKMSKLMLERQREEKFKEINQEVIGEDLSFMSDLSLSNLNQSFSQINRNQTVKRTIRSEKKNEKEPEKVNFLELIESTKKDEFDNKNNIIFTKDKLIVPYFDELEGKDFDEFEEKVSYQRPISILTSIMKLKDDIELEKKLKRLREKFNLNDFMKKQKRRGTNIKNVNQKRHSFLNFLKYTQEPDNLDNYILKSNANNLNRESVEKNNAETNEINTKSNNELIDSEMNDLEEKIKNSDNMGNVSFLSKDSYISIDQNVSMNDIKLIPKEIKENINFYSESMSAQNLPKNLEGNKYIQLIRRSIFDRSSVNTNIDLTSKEQSRYYKKMNKILNRNLYSDKNQPRGRKPGDLNVSYLASEKNYENYLIGEEILEENMNDENNNSFGIEITNEINQETPIKGKKTYRLKETKTNDNSKGTRMTQQLTTENLLNTKTMKNSEIGNNLNQVNNELTTKNQIGKKKNDFYIFKAKSIEKNMDKYPKENSNDLLVKEENRPYTDPLTIQQESIPDNLRGKKYYMNYLYNILDKDLKVKDTFKVDHWVNEILGKKEKFIKKKPLPESKEAFFVFNDKKLNLIKYKYSYHKDFEFKDDEVEIIQNKLKYLPRSVLETMPSRLRNFGKYTVDKEVKSKILGFKPNSMNIVNLNKNQVLNTNTRSGKTFSTNIKNKSTLISSSAFSNQKKVNEEVRNKKILNDKVYKKINEFNYNTLANYFTEEEQLYSKFIEEEKKMEKLKQLEERNNEKENRLIVKDEISNIQIYDMKTNSRRYVQWSGADVLSNKDEDENRKKWNKIINALEDFNMIIWHQNPAVQRMQKLRYAFYLVAISDYFGYVILTVVLINSVFMALDGNLFKPEVLNKLNIANYIFNSIFFLEYIVKFIGLSPLVYYSDAFTYLDTIIIAFACLDMATPSTTDDEQVGSKKSVSSQLSFLRVFRIFRVIRLTKILRKLKSMKRIIVSMKKALASVSYIVCILIIFILIFELLGMSLLSGNIHYQQFGEGFFITYQILTLENWDSLLYELWPMNYFCFFYFVVWIFLGNYIIFNLFTSVLLQSFGQDDEDDADDYTDDEKVENMYPLPDYLYAIKKAEIEHRKTLKMRHRAKQETESYKDNQNEKEEEEEEQVINNKISQSKSLIKSQISNSRNASKINMSMMSRESASNIFNDDEDDQDDSHESNKNYNYVERKKKEWAEINKLFRKNECENAFYLLSQTNKFRIFCLKLMNNKWFDRFILIMILMSTARLIVDTFISGYTFVLIFDVLDAFFNSVFLLEAGIKICALGFVLDEGSYLRDNWNKIDIIIVICSIFDFENLIEKYGIGSQSNSSLQFLKVLRLLRTLRPLRFISHNIQLKLIITSLFDSILPICNALFIVIVVYYIFSIVGISLFYESLHNCYVMQNNGSFKLAIGSFNGNLADYEVSNDMPSISKFCADKYNGIMDTGPSFKFSNILTSIITSYVLSTQEGWPDIMNSYRVYGDIYGAFFIIYNLVVAYFFLNLFTGIMFLYFNEAYSREQKLADDDKKAPKYYDFLTQIPNAQSDYEIWVRPSKGTLRYYLREFADSNFLDNFIMACIFLNMISMAMNFDNPPEAYNQALVLVNYIFTGVFIAECILKLLAYGPIGYFHSGWNKFDFFVVIASIVDLIVDNIDGIDASFLKSFQIIRVLRVLRVTRVLRLVKALKGLEKLIQTLTWSISALANVFLLMLIIFCIFAILGCYFYDGIVYENYKNKFIYVNEYYNVDNFYNSFLLTFRCATGENWPNIMMELAFIDIKVVPEAYAYIFMIISNFVNSIIMLNLFLMVTLQQYDEFTNKNYNPIEKFESFLGEFNSSWNKFTTPEDNGIRIKKEFLVNFFMDYNWKKLNFPEKGKLQHVKKFITDLRLRSDKEGNIYYLDVICKIIISQIGSQVDKKNPDNALIIRTEKKIQNEIKKIINSYISKTEKKEKGKKENAITFNPLTTHFYFKHSYYYIKTILNIYRENLRFMSHFDDEPSKDSQLMDDDNDITENNLGSERGLNLIEAEKKNK